MADASGAREPFAVNAPVDEVEAEPRRPARRGRGLCGRCCCRCRTIAGVSVVLGAVAVIVWLVVLHGGGGSDSPGSLSERALTFAKLAGASYCPVDDLKTWSCGFKCIQGVSDVRTCAGETTKGYVAKWGDGCIVSFMGTKEYSAMITDLEIAKQGTTWAGCTDCWVHEGFYNEWKSMESCVLDSLSSLGCSGGQNSLSSRGVHVTGHSLGGAVAALAMMALSERGFSVKESWTFGMPRTGDENFAKDFISRFSDRFYRVTHHMDPVPHLPPVDLVIDWHYHHVEPEMFYDGSMSSGFLTCSEDNDENCSGKYYDVLLDAALHIGDHMDYMDIEIGSPGCGKNEMLGIASRLRG